MNDRIARIEHAARRVAVWARIARAAWRLSAEAVPCGGRPPVANVSVAIRPDGNLPPSPVNPEYRLGRATVATLGIEAEQIDVTMPWSTCKEYLITGNGDAVLIAYWTGRTADIVRVVDGA